jgi:uncharacterized OsmC-like protein
MSTTTTTPTTTTPAVERNGVPTHKLFGTIAKLKENGQLAAFRFAARNQWIDGTASRSTVHEWHGVGADHVHIDEFEFTADHPTLGHGYGVTPHEFVLHALASCITAGIATGAAARKIDLTSVTSTVSGDIDVRGLLGIDDDVRVGFSEIRIDFDVQGDADRETLDALIESATKYSVVYDALTGATPVVVGSVN